MHWSYWSLALSHQDVLWEKGQCNGVWSIGLDFCLWQFDDGWCTQILQGCFSDTGAIIWLPQCQWAKQPRRIWVHTSWASCQIRKIVGAHAPGMPGTFSPSPQVSDPDMHHGTCVTHVPWCMPRSLTSGFIWNRRRGKTFPAFPAHAQPTILRIW